MISLGAADRPQRAPPGWEKKIVVIGHPTFRDGLDACLNIAFAYSGNQGFVTVMAEMKDAGKDFIPALVMLQAFAIPTYTIVAVVIYALAGEYTTSPALGSAPIVPAKVAYGVFLPCLLGTAIVFGHTAVKYLFVVALRRIGAEEDYTRNTKRSWSLWIGIGVVFWILAFLLANAIPVFTSILSIMAALFVAWFTFGLSAVLWLFLNWKTQFSSKRRTALAILNWTIIVVTIFVNVAGMWASVSSLLAVFGDPTQEINGPFTCADNSLF